MPSTSAIRGSSSSLAASIDATTAAAAIGLPANVDVCSVGSLLSGSCLVTSTRTPSTSSTSMSSFTRENELTSPVSAGTVAGITARAAGRLGGFLERGERGKGTADTRESPARRR